VPCAFVAGTADVALGRPALAVRRARIHVRRCDIRQRPARAGPGRLTSTSDPFVGQVIAVGFNFAPIGWALCDGQLLSISQYDVLYNLIGTTYGGDGVSTFAVPNLNGRTPLGQTQGYVLGQSGGSENVTLTSAQNAGHNHALNATSATGTTATPGNTVVLATGPASAPPYGAPPSTTNLLPASVGMAGNSIPHENRQPFNTVNYIICLFGIYPSPG
jgi:microcystin-dependent protein